MIYFKEFFSELDLSARVHSDNQGNASRILNKAKETNPEGELISISKAGIPTAMLDVLLEDSRDDAF